MVEVLCGVMSGGPYAGHIRKWTGDPSKADLVWKLLKSSTYISYS